MTNYYIKTIVFGLFSIVFFLDLQATTYYVSPSGNDSNPGTISSPWQTPQKAANTLTAGDLVYFRAGVYNGSMYPKNSGTAGNYITYAGYPGETAIFDGNLTSGTGFHMMSSTIDHEFITIKDLTIRNYTSGGIMIGYGKNDFIIQNVEIHNCYRYGIFLGNITNILIDGLNTHDHANPSSNTDGYGMYVESAENMEVKNSIIHNNHRDGIVWFGYTSDYNRNLRIHHCEVFDNGRQGLLFFRTDGAWLHDIETYSNGATGIQVETATYNFLIQRIKAYACCDIYNSETGIWIDECDTAVLEDCEIYNNEKGIGMSQCHNVIVRNNIIHNNNGQNSTYHNNNSGMSFGPGSVGSSQPNGFTKNAIYNNTWHSNGYAGSVAGNLANHSGDHSNILNNYYLNNIVSETVGSYEVRMDNQSGILDFADFDYNNYYRASGSLLFYLTGATSYTNWKTSTGFDANSIVDNPLFTDKTNYDFSLQAGAPGIDAGRFLTRTTSSGVSSILFVADVSFFSDGLGFVSGDRIYLDDGQSANITSIDRNLNLLVLDSQLTFSSGQGVSLRYCGAAPDMGAIEYNSCSLLDLKVFLEGPLNPATLLMSDSLGLDNLLPETDPYKNAYTVSTPAIFLNRSVVDWIWVELRDANALTTIVASQAALLLNTGEVISADGRSLAFNVGQGNYSIFVKHRNHLAVMSPQPISFGEGQTTVFDFTTQDSYQDIGSGAKEVISGVWAMYVGDGSPDPSGYDINFEDKLLWNIENGNFQQYLNGDFNFDGDVNGMDNVIFYPNFGIFSSIPK